MSAISCGDVCVNFRFDREVTVSDMVDVFARTVGYGDLDLIVKRIANDCDKSNYRLLFCGTAHTLLYDHERIGCAYAHDLLSSCVKSFDIGFSDKFPLFYKPIFTLTMTVETEI